MKKLEMFDNSPRLASAIQTIADAYRHTIRLKNNTLDFKDIILEEDVSIIVATLRKENVRTLSISGFYSNLGEVLSALQANGFKISGVIRIRTGLKKKDRITEETTPALLLNDIRAKATVKPENPQSLEDASDEKAPNSGIKIPVETIEDQPAIANSGEQNTIEGSESVCLNCGKPLEPISKGRVRKFCSAECRRAWWKTHPEESNPRSESVVSQTCTYCGKQFKTWGNRHQKYCSQKCYLNARFGEDRVHS